MPRFFIGFLLSVTVLSTLAMGRSFEDVEYSHPGSLSLRLDGYVPDGRGPFPAVIIVHGGGWVIGDRKRSVQPLFAPLAEAGFAWFSIDYRLADVTDINAILSGAASPAALNNAIDDVRAAVAFLKHQSAAYNIDPNRFALLGESAGGQLAAMAVLKREPGAKPPVDGGVRAVVGFYSPTDLVKLFENAKQIPESVRRALQSGPFGGLLEAKLRELSPITWVRADAPPFLLIHGTEDPFVPFDQSVQMCNALRKAGASCDLYPVEHRGHGVRFWEPAKVRTVCAYMTTWLKQRLSPA